MPRRLRPAFDSFEAGQAPATDCDENTGQRSPVPGLQAWAQRCSPWRVAHQARVGSVNRGVPGRPANVALGALLVQDLHE